MTFLRKLVACLALAALVWVTMTPGSIGLLWAIIVPILLCAGLVAVSTIDRRPEGASIPMLPGISALVPRAPPAC